MPRPPRLLLPGLAHYVLLLAHDQRQVAVDALDRQHLVRAVEGAAQGRALEVHALAATPQELHLLLRPGDAGALSAAVQWLGRRYVAQYNRRHGQRGTLWAGRFRAAVVEPGAAVLAVLHHIDSLDNGTLALGSAHTRTGLAPGLPWLRQPDEFWQLGNTPFERERAWRERLGQTQPASVAQRLRDAARSGKVFGAPGFIAELSAQAGRSLVARGRGRPLRAA
jgi:putative transposase